jgi:hypothetical protein
MIQCFLLPGNKSSKSVFTCTYWAVIYMGQQSNLYMYAVRNLVSDDSMFIAWCIGSDAKRRDCYLI